MISHVKADVLKYVATLLLGAAIGIGIGMAVSADTTPKRVQFYEDQSWGLWVNGKYYQGCLEGGLCDDN